MTHENKSEPKTSSRRRSTTPGTGFLATVSRILLLLILLILLVLPFTPYASRIKKTIGEYVDKARETKVIYRDVPKTVVEEKTVFQEKTVVKEKIVEIPAPPPPLPSKFVSRKEMDVATLYNGITIQTKLDTAEGTYASVERGDKDAYTVEFQLKIRVPKPNSTVTELARVNAHLPKILPGLESMVASGKVSGFYHKLYDKKTTLVQQNLTRLNKLLDRHNYFDCETILELTHPQTGRKVMLIQSEMDVVADGSDGDRMPDMSADIYTSDYYQPFTSYEWAKRGTTANPLLARWQARYDAAKKEFAQKGLPTARNAELKAEMQDLDATMKAMKARSSLIAEKDPFIVISLLFRDYINTLPHTPRIGDYAAVVHGDKIYPAICGDYGPSIKMGEASLMMAKTINPKATPYTRPESDLEVTYIIFPGTAEKPFGPPNLDAWHEKVSQYLTESGGLGDGYTLHKWENPFPAPPAPVPAPEPTPPAPAPVPTATPPAETTPVPAPVPTPAPTTPGQ